MKCVRINKLFPIILFTVFLILPETVYSERIKDIASIKGFRENKLVGYGLVVGLNGTGDKKGAAIQSVVNMLYRMGLSVNKKDIQTKNTAAVMITATMPPFPKMGQQTDALVSALVDSKSLQGGTLLLTPMKGPNGKVYALAQGPISIGGFAAGAGGSGVQKNHPTVGKIPGGVMIEREVPFSMDDVEDISIILHRPDFTTASNVKRVVNKALKGPYSVLPDPATIRISIPDEYRDYVVDFVRYIEALNVEVDVPAKIVINERTGTVIIGEKVEISPVAIAHGNLTIEIKEETQVSQPPTLAPESAETVVAPQQQVDVTEQQASLVKISGTTLSEVINALNKLGVTPRDLIAILQSLKASGALKAELEII